MKHTVWILAIATPFCHSDQLRVFVLGEPVREKRPSTTYRDLLKGYKKEPLSDEDREWFAAHRLGQRTGWAHNNDRALTKGTVLETLGVPQDELREPSGQGGWCDHVLLVFEEDPSVKIPLIMDRVRAYFDHVTWLAPDAPSRQIEIKHKLYKHAITSETERVI